MVLYAHTFNIGTITISPVEPFFLIAGPCVIESESHVLRMAEMLKELTTEIDIRFIFKSSFDKANRSSKDSYRGPGFEDGLEVLAKAKEQFDLLITTDVHVPSQIPQAAEVVDLIQIPAFLCRQTDMLVTATKTGKPVNVKKGQFISPWEVDNIVRKVTENGGIAMVTERGYSFGYNNLVVDFRSLPVIREKCPVIFDGTHSIQLPGGFGSRSDGQRQFAPYLTKAAVAVGIDGLFLEVHDDPGQALCDGPNMIPFKELKPLLKSLMDLDQHMKVIP